MLKDMWSLINRVMDKKTIAQLVDKCYREGGEKVTVILSDRLKDLGYFYATLGGISICVDDMKIPTKKKELMDQANKEVIDVQRQHSEGLITDGERYNKVIDIWADVTERIADELMKELGSEKVQSPDGKTRVPEQSEPHIHDGTLRRARQCPADQAARRHEGTHGEAFRRDHRDADHQQLQGRARRAPVLYIDPRRQEGPRRHSIEDGELRVSDKKARRRGPGRSGLEVDCGTFDGIEVSSLIEGGEVIEHLECENPWQGDAGRPEGPRRRDNRRERMKR